jgi:hypothetical protein
VAAAEPEDEVIEGDDAEDQVEGPAEEIEEEVVAAPPPKAAPKAAPKASVAKPAAAPKAPAPKAAAPAPKAAAPATKAAPKAAAAPAAVKTAPKAPLRLPLAAKAAKPIVVGAPPAKLTVVLPEEIGGRIAQDSAFELFHRFLEAHGGPDGRYPNLKMATKAASVMLIEAVFDFLIGDLKSEGPSPTIESIVENGGLVRLYEAKIGKHVHFKHSAVEQRVYMNPRTDVPPGTFVRISNRTHVEMRAKINPGTTEVGTIIDGEFVPNE